MASTVTEGHDRGWLDAATAGHLLDVDRGERRAELREPTRVGLDVCGVDQALLRDDPATALKLAGRLQDIVGADNLFIELQDHGIAKQRFWRHIRGQRRDAIVPVGAFGVQRPRLLEVRQVSIPRLVEPDSFRAYVSMHESTGMDMI